MVYENQHNSACAWNDFKQNNMLTLLQHVWAATTTTIIIILHHQLTRPAPLSMAIEMKFDINIMKKKTIKFMLEYIRTPHTHTHTHTNGIMPFTHSYTLQTLIPVALFRSNSDYFINLIRFLLILLHPVLPHPALSHFPQTLFLQIFLFYF